MLEYFSIVLLIQFEFSYAPEAYENGYEALEIQSKFSIEPKYACPAEFVTDIALLHKLSKRHYELDYCLFHKDFERENEKLCQIEARPIFVVYIDQETNKPVKCGSGKNQFLHYFGYYYCGEQEKLSQLRTMKKSRDLKKLINTLKANHIPTYIYDVCYDVSKKKAIWTKHTILRPSHFQDSSLQEQSYHEDNVTKDPFFFKSNLFLKIEQLYEKEERKHFGSRLLKKPQSIVPAEHFLKRIWKKTTNHYINMAPLLKALIPLMKAINEGLKTAALKLSQQESTSQKQELVVYTRVEELHKSGFFGKIARDTLKENIWYKFVYNSLTKQGVMIYIHSSHPSMIKRKCSEENGIDCNFTKWSYSMTPLAASSFIDLQYAYCCKVTSEETQKIFSKGFDIQKDLDIQALIIQ